MNENENKEVVEEVVNPTEEAPVAEFEETHVKEEEIVAENI